MRTLFDRAADRHILTGDFVLWRPDGSSVTVGELLAEPDRWHQARFCDPLEPDYRDDKRIAYANLDPSSGHEPYIWSHAHGGQRYRLQREMPEIVLRTGERPRVLDMALSVIRDRGDLYERGGEMVRVAGDVIRPVNDLWLSDYLGRIIRFYTEVQNGAQSPADPPGWLSQQINAKSGERGLRVLNGIITAPTLRPDGSLLCASGYDETTGLLLRGAGWPSVSESPSQDELKKAFKAIWTPFSSFPFVTKEDRAVMLSCVLPGIIRPNLPRAPAFSFDAPTAGSGKTLLGLCVLRLCGSTPTVIPECREEDELRKRLLAALREGKPGILLDNIRGQFGSASLEAFLTAESYSDRVLGVSQIVTLPTNVLLMISGNNFHAKGDLYRRVLQARIDPQTDAPERRCFDLDPLQYCLEHRQALVAAALTLLRGFVAAGKPRLTPDRLASFEDWDDIVRQCVLWLDQQGIAELGDPTACIETAKEQEPERQKLAALLESAAAIMGDADWRVADLIRRSDDLTLPQDSILEFSSARSALKDAIEEIAGERGSINHRRLGRWIESREGCRCAGFYLQRQGTKQRAVLWRIRRYGSGLTAENNSPNSPNSLLSAPGREPISATLHVAAFPCATNPTLTFANSGHM